ncbi:MAG: hypothetical protein OXB84_04870, partial [Halobacteriovoraceae bacterium]|nr:hypothetical protein [Halobacteriovoraceae bacterium]
FTELTGQENTSCPKEESNTNKFLETMSKCIDAVINDGSNPTRFINEINTKMDEHKALLSKLSNQIASIMLGKNYQRLEIVKDNFARNLNNCSNFSIRNCALDEYVFNEQDGILTPNSTPHRLLMDGNNIIGALPMKITSVNAPGQPPIDISGGSGEVTLNEIEALRDLKQKDHCNHKIVRETLFCQRAGENERQRRREQNARIADDQYDSLTNLHSRYNIFYEIDPDGNVTTRNLGERKQWWQYPEATGSLGMMGVMAIQGAFQRPIWNKYKDSTINQYKFAKTQSWWKRQDCVNTYIGLEYLCMPQGYAYNNPWGSGYGLNPQAASNFCLECNTPQNISINL